MFAAVVLFSLVLALSLAACGAASGGTTTSPAPTPSTPSTATAAQMVTYRGKGFTTDFPQGWVVTPQANGSVTFALPPRQSIKFLVNITENAHGTATSAQVVELGLSCSPGTRPGISRWRSLQRRRLEE
jgi:hypothetical protein